MTMMILIDLFPFGLGNGDETGLSAVDGTAGPLDLDVPIVFYMNDYYKAYVSYVITLIIIFWYNHGYVGYRLPEEGIKNLRDRISKSTL